MAVLTDDRMDPSLEIWVDANRSPVLVRLVGTLDNSTSASVLRLVHNLFAEGVQQLTIDVAGAEVVGSGAAALAMCQTWAAVSVAGPDWIVRNSSTRGGYEPAATP